MENEEQFGKHYGAMSVKIVMWVYVSYRALKYVTHDFIINYQSKLLNLKYMHRIFKKNCNWVIKNFIPMFLRREQRYPSHIAVAYRLRVIRVKLCRREKQLRAKFSPT